MKKLLILIVISSLWACNQYDNPTMCDLEHMQTILEREPATDSIRVNSFEAIRLSQSILSPLSVDARSSAYAVLDSVIDDCGHPLIYIINWGDNGGYLLLSALKTATPVLACNERGHFNPHSDNESLNFFIEIIKDNVKNTLSMPQDSTMINKLLWSLVENHGLNLSSRSEPENGEDFDSWPSSLKEKFYQSTSVIMDSVASWGYKNYYNLKDYDNSQLISDKTGNQVTKEEVYSAAKNSCYWEFQTNYKPLSLVRFIIWDEINGASSFLETKWGQGYHNVNINSYNMSFPTKDDSKYGLYRAYAGCGPVAIGQIMKFYKWPSNYDWNSMPNDYPSKTTSDLLYDIATAAKADYKYTGTGISTSDANNTFIKFGYKTSGVKGFDIITDLSDFVKAGKPVYVRAENEDGGHAFVACGYRSSFYRNSMVLYTITSPKVFKQVARWDLRNFFAESVYINWGYEGKDDGYYNTQYLNVNGTTYNKKFRYILATPNK